MHHGLKNVSEETMSTESNHLPKNGETSQPPRNKLRGKFNLGVTVFIITNDKIRMNREKAMSIMNRHICRDLGEPSIITT